MVKNCIYRIINKTNNKVYIGSTIDSERRKIEHLSQLEKGVHINQYFQRSFNKHGKDAFIFDVIEHDLDEGELIKKEQFYINLFNSSNSEFGYNISPYADRPDGRKTTKVFTVALREELKKSNLKIGSMSLLCFLQCFIEPYTNKLTKPNGKNFANIELAKGIGVSIKSLESYVKELADKNFIKRVGHGQSREIYFNPNIATAGGEVQQEIYDMFK